MTFASRLCTTTARAAAVLCVCLLSIPHDAAAQSKPRATPRPPAKPVVVDSVIDMASFAGTSNLPVWVAQDKGYFAQNGVIVHLARVDSVAAQIAGVMAGKYPLFMTAIDNIVAYQEGQGVTAPPLTDMFAFMGVHHGLNSLVVKPEVMTYQDMRGRKMGVDTLASGYAFVLYRLLERNDLTRGEDYKVVALGGPVERFEALKAGRIDGTLLSAPNDAEAEELGFTILAEPSDLVGGYEGTVYATRRSWAKSHQREMLAVTRSLIAAHDAIRADKAGSIAILRAHIRGLSEERAELVYKGLIDEKGGLSKRGEINIEGVKTVLELRSEMGVPKKSLTDPYRYIDTSYFDQALGQ